MPGLEDDRLIREAECASITGVSRATRWRWEREGVFPRRVRIGPNSIGWRYSELRAWLAGRNTA